MFFSAGVKSAGMNVFKNSCYEKDGRMIVKDGHHLLNPDDSSHCAAGHIPRKTRELPKTGEKPAYI